MNKTIEAVTKDIVERSRASREQYVQAMMDMQARQPPKQRLSCGNMAHAYAACGSEDKQALRLMQSANLGIVTAYNDMLSAHQPLKDYPEIIKQAARELGSTAQVAGGVPAMCDGVTQGQPGMELSLFSRDVIAMATAVSLSHNVFDGVLCLGVCDKIVPGMMIGALQFGHLPVGFVPAGPMPSGLPNKEKAAVRQRFAEGKASKDELLDAESASYHSPGTCTFYGTANSNQVLMEMLGVQLPGASFVNPDDPQRQALTIEAVRRVIDASHKAPRYLPLYEVVTEASIVNACVALLATGGSTNHALHLVAMAEAAGIKLLWSDLDRLSKAVPLLTRVYPNGQADINVFQQAGGMAYLVYQLRSAGLLNENVRSLLRDGLDAYECQPEFESEASSHRLQWKKPVTESSVPDVLTSVDKPFSQEGGLRMLSGNLGLSVAKVSAVAEEHQIVEAECVVFAEQDELQQAFEAGELNKDVVVVMRFQGPKANGMPELHKLTPYLGVLQDRGYKVALVTDGRMSGASGKVLAAIHLCPEALEGGPISRLRSGDVIRVDAQSGDVRVLVDDDLFNAREAATYERADNSLGRGLFKNFRNVVGPADSGALVW
ncbi:MAG: phosphogluconate dehydratase [Pseudomonadales bacterium]